MTTWTRHEEALLEPFLTRRADVPSLAPILPGRTPLAILERLKRLRRAAGVRIDPVDDDTPLPLDVDRRFRSRTTAASQALLAAIARHHPDRLTGGALRSAPPVRQEERQAA